MKKGMFCCFVIRKMTLFGQLFYLRNCMIHNQILKTLLSLKSRYQVYNHRDPKKVLNLQAAEANDIKQDALESVSNADPTEQKENQPETENRINNCTSPDNFLSET